MRKKYHTGAVMFFLACLALAVVLFPIAFDNPKIYEGFLLSSIAILILLMLFLIKVNILDSK